jgi:hypothetical protein
MNPTIAVKVFGSSGNAGSVAAQGAKRVEAYTPDTFKDLNAVAGGSIVTVWTPATGKKVRFMGLTISASAACSVLFEDNAAAATVFRTPKLLADTPYTFDLGNGSQLAAADNVLKMTSSAAANITGTLYGVEI